MSSFFQDVRYGLKGFFRQPGFTLASVLALGMGMGAATALFSVIDAVLLRPLPYGTTDRLVSLREMSQTMGPMSVSWPNFVDWREQSRVFDEMAIQRFDSFNLTGTSEPERLTGRIVSAPYFSVLGVSPLLGRAFRPEEDRPGAGPVALLSQGLWERRFGSDPSVVGKPVSLNGVPHVVIGIVPAPLARLQGTDVYVPLGLRREEFDHRGLRSGLTAIAVLKPGVTIEQARSEMATIAARLAEQYPQDDKDVGVMIDFQRERLLGGARGPLLLLLGAVGVVLFIACANVAGLVLARAAGRHAELAVRTALGAGRTRLVRQLLTESVLLAVLGGCLGVVLAFWGTDALLTAGGAQNVPRIDEVRLDGRVLLFSFLVSAATGILFGLLPALQASRPDVVGSLKDSTRTTTRGGASRLRRSLVVVQVALTVVLLTGGGLLLRSFLGVLRVDPGFRAEGVLAASLSVPTTRTPSTEEWMAFHQEVLERVQALPGIDSAAAATDIPMLGGGSESRFGIEGRPMDQGAPTGQFVAVTPDYFRAMGVPLVRGRAFSEHDDASAPPVVIIDETLARQHFPGEDPIGKRLAFEGDPEHPGWRTIVGVVGHTLHYGIEARSFVQMYVPFRQLDEGHRQHRPDMAFFVRGGPEAGDLAAGLRAAVRAVEPDQPVYLVRALGDILADQMAGRRFSTLLLGVFASVALVLAAVGIFGVLSYLVARRTRELGVRMALGAGASDILALVLREAMKLLGIGLPVGLAASLLATRLLTGTLYGVSSRDPLTFVAVTVVLLVVAALACSMPAFRATRVDPVIALRSE